MNPLTVLMPGFVGTEAPEWLSRRLADGLGGVCLFADNVGSPGQLRSLTSALYAARSTAVVSMDEEGGDVTRLYQREGSPFPGNAVLGRLDDVGLTRGVGERVGLELRDAGVGLALAPDADVNSNPANPVIGVRSFGADPARVAVHAAAWIEGLQAAGVAACAKHFPGHGDTRQDSHVALPVVSADLETLRTRELVPFAAAIAAGTRTIMTSHIMVPALDSDHPATFSHRILAGLLRDEMGFDGVIVTDALDMAGASARIGIPAAAVAALAAGADLLCLGTRNTDEQIAQIVVAIEDALADGTLPASRLAEAIERVERLGNELALGRALPDLDPAAAPAPAPAVGDAGLDVADVARAFHVTDTARALLTGAGAGAVAFVALESAVNVAVGDAPWGPFAAGVKATARIGSHRDIEGALAAVAHAPVIVAVGKDIHRHDFARAAVEHLRAARETVVVDMGWPLPTFDGVDIATFGASRIVGQALIELIGRDSCGLE